MIAGMEQANRVTLPDDGIGLKEYLGFLEGHLILQALDRTGGNRRRAAEQLYMNRTTLVMKIRKYFPNGTPVIRTTSGG